MNAPEGNRAILGVPQATRGKPRRLSSKIGGRGDKKIEKRMTENAKIPRRRGGQPSNRNALKHGWTTQEAKTLQKIVRERIRSADAAIRYANLVSRLVRAQKAAPLEEIPTHPLRIPRA
jgi:hypothetical protein